MSAHSGGLCLAGFELGGQLVALLPPIIGVELAVLVVPLDAGKAISRGSLVALGSVPHGLGLSELLRVQPRNVALRSIQVERDLFEVVADGGVDYPAGDRPLVALALISHPR